MKFFAHDGSTVHGPAPVPELLELPGFDGDTLVCPVGSENSADWKPALAYPPFREALLSPAPRPAPPPTPPPAPRPAPTAPCPRCAAPNPERARYCNECGARMDGTAEAPPREETTPLVAMAPVELPRPMATPAPMAAPPPAQEVSSLEPSFVLPTDIPAAPPSPAPVAAAPAPAPATDAASLRNTLLAAFIGASAASGGLGYYLLRPHAAKAPANHEIEMTPPPAPAAPAPAATPAAPAPIASPAPTASPAPVAETPVPAVVKAPPAQTAPPAAPKRARRAKRKPKPAPVEKPAAPVDDGNGGGESLIESRVNSMDGAAAEPKTAAAAKSAPLAPPEGEKPAEASAAAASSAPDGGFMLPGVPRPVSAKSVTKAKTAAKTPAKTAGALTPDAPAAAATTASPDAAPAAEDETTHQVREQFEFCTQLLSQGAFDDHFDTCLCAQTRNGAPYRGRRGLYASALKKSAAAGKLETSAAVSSIVLDGAVAKVTASWKAGPDDKPRALVERWQLEDGLWCRAP